MKHTDAEIRINPTIEDIIEYADAAYQKHVQSGASGLLAVPIRLPNDKLRCARPSTDACGWCGKKAKEVEGSLKQCSGCRKILYCGKECQKKDWQEHKVVCKLN